MKVVNKNLRRMIILTNYDYVRAMKHLALTRLSRNPPTARARRGASSAVASDLKRAFIAMWNRNLAGHITDCRMRLCLSFGQTESSMHLRAARSLSASSPIA